MGLFDGLFSDDPQKQALLMMGLGLLQGAPQGKKNFGADLAHGGLMGMQGYNQANILQTRKREEDQQREMRAMQMEQMKRGLQEDSDMRSLAQRSFAPPQTMQPDPREFDQMGEGSPQPSPFQTPGGGGLPQLAEGMMRINPLKAVAFQQSLAKESAFGKVDPDKFTPESLAAFQRSAHAGKPDFSVLKPRTKMEVSGGAAYDPYNITPGSFVAGPQSQVISDGKGGWIPNPAFIALAQAKRPQVNVDVKQEGAFAQEVGKKFGQTYNDLMVSEAGASGKINKLNRLESLLDSSGKTGKLTPSTMELKAVADSLGFKVDPKLPYQQAAQALSNELALEMRNPSGGAGMPGAMSDADRVYLTNMVPNLAKTPEGNKLLLESARKLAQREREVGKLAREYKTKHGKFDEGFYQILSDYSERNPLFPAAQANPIDDLVNKYKSR